MKKISAPILYIKEGVICTEHCLFQPSAACIVLSARTVRAGKNFIGKLKNAWASWFYWLLVRNTSEYENI
jgi:hypothetical protein